MLSIATVYKTFNSFFITLKERQEREAEEKAIAEAGLETLDRLESQPDTNT